MIKIVLFIVLLFTVINYAQEEVFDKMELRNGDVLVGKVVKIKADMIEFKDNNSGLLYESRKEDIRYILLANGEVLTFEEYQSTEQNETQPETIIIEKESGTSVGLIILATLGALFGLLLIIGAIAQ